MVSDDVNIIEGSPRYIFVRVAAPCFSALLVVIHGLGSSYGAGRGESFLGVLARPILEDTEAG